MEREIVHGVYIYVCVLCVCVCVCVCVVIRTRRACDFVCVWCLWCVVCVCGAAEGAPCGVVWCVSRVETCVSRIRNTAFIYV